MANIEMSNLKYGEDTFEIVDAAARQSISELEVSIDEKLTSYIDEVAALVGGDA